MIYIVWSIVVLAAFFFQGRLSVLGVAPDLTAIIAYYSGIRYGEVRGMFIGGGIGVVQDSLSLALLGPHMAGKGLVGLFSSFFVTGGVFRWSPVLGVIALFFLTFFDNAIVYTCRSIFKAQPTDIGSALFIAVMQSLLNAPAGIFIRPKHAD